MLTVLGIIAVPANGEIIFPISGVQKQALIVDCQATCYLYDVELTLRSSDKDTVRRGTVRIVEDITE